MVYKRRRYKILAGPGKNKYQGRLVTKRSLRMGRKPQIPTSKAKRVVIRNNVHLYEVIPDNAWKGCRCFIIGGGPSLKDFDWSRLNGELVIGINRSFEKFDGAINFSMDSRLWGWLESSKVGRTEEERQSVRRKWNDYRGLRVWLNTIGFPYPEDVLTLEAGRGSGFTKSLSKGLGVGCNSGYSALNLAICLGADPIYLLGFDMQGDNKGHQDWYHSGYPQVQKDEVYARFKSYFEKQAPRIKQRVINLNPNSALKCFEFGKFEDIPKIKRPIVISYFTKGGIYERHAQEFEKSVHIFGFEQDIAPIDDLGSWQANTQHKATFILKALKKHCNRSVVFIDADARMVQYPQLFNDLKADVAAHWREYSKFPSSNRRAGNELLSGTIFFNNTPQAKKLLELWIGENKLHPDRWEQKNVQALLESNIWKGNFKNLPASYCQIFDTMAKAGEPVIEHFQASRQVKK